MKNKKMGRPKLPKGETKEAQVAVRFKPDEMIRIEKAATVSGFTNSQLVRSATLDALSRSPYWYKSKWRAQDLNDQKIEFKISTNHGLLAGIGILKVRENAHGEIVVDLFAGQIPTPQNPIAPGIQLWLQGEAIDKIEIHLDQKVAKYFVAG
jgi:hypothetical protein